LKAKLFTLNHVVAGFTTVLVGYASSIVIIIQAATASGASPEQIESWLFALGIGMGVTSIAYSWFYKMPILTAWSTPGAVILIASAASYDLTTLIGAFVISGIFIFITGLISPLSNALQRIPSPLATAMLAAILLPFCIKAFEPIMEVPIAFFAMLLAFVIGKRFVAKYMMLLLLVVGLISAYFLEASFASVSTLSLPKPIWLMPTFELSAILNISIPLYIVTMLSQNISGIAMMKSYQYRPPVKPMLTGTGLTSAVLAPLGGFSINLAAITAAICMNEDVDENKDQRYKAAIWGGLFYIIAGLMASSVVTLFLSFPTSVSQMIAGFALLGTLLMCLQSAFEIESYREAALLTFLVTASGITFLGVSSILWGLVIGGLYSVVMKLGKS